MNYQETWGKKSSHPCKEKILISPIFQIFAKIGRKIAIFSKIHQKLNIKLLGLREDPRSSE